MSTLLILYPTLFASQSKFERKVRTLTRNMTRCELVYLSDPHDFISRFQASATLTASAHGIDSLQEAGITHAIVFDDGEEFQSERAWLAENAIPTRWVKIPITRVINIKREPDHPNRNNGDDYEYIGRGSYWGNPHSMFAEGDSREEVIRKYEYDFIYDKFINIDPRRVHELAGKRLGCFCKPAICHGDILADHLNSFDDGK